MEVCLTVLTIILTGCVTVVFAGIFIVTLLHDHGEDKDVR